MPNRDVELPSPRHPGKTREVGNAASDAEAALLNQAFGEILADARAEADALRHDAEA